MSSNPLNLGLRFILEIAALLSVGAWGWNKGAGVSRFLLAVGIPLIIAFLWATFRVPNDPGTAPVAIPGIIRLIFEFAVFGFAVWSLTDIQQPKLAWIFSILLLGHYITSYDRILRLMKK